MNGDGEEPLERKRKVYSIKNRKLFRDESEPRRTPPDDFAGVEKPTDSELKNVAISTVKLFPSITSLADDIYRQRGGARAISSDNFQATTDFDQARQGYERELLEARRLQREVLADTVRTMFHGYNPLQKVVSNSKYVAYARAYLEKFDPSYQLPDMRL